MNKILSIGSQGQLGRELQMTLPALGEVIGVGRNQLDLTQPDRIRELIQSVQPNIIVNAAAYTAVDKAESESDIAYAVNGLAPEIMAREAEKLSATLLHVSTDYVFDGWKNTPYLEEDRTNPLGIYGKSKLVGEKGIQETEANYIILRTAWVYGTYGKSNFVKTMLRLGKERETLNIVCDQVGSPTWAKDIADAITQLLIETKQSQEIYHFANSGVASWYDLAKAIFEEAKQMNFDLKIQQVEPITTSDYPTPAVRPFYSVLSGKKITPILGNSPPYWRDSLKAMLEQLYSQTL